MAVLSEIEPLTPADVSASAQLLRYSDTAAASAKKLVQGILKPLSRNPERRRAAIAMGIELLLSQNEVKVARKLLQEHVIEFTTLDKQQLVAYDSVVTIANAVVLAHDVCKLSNVALKVPCIEDIINDPLEFSKCIKIINMTRATASFANAKLKSKRQECNQMMRDLKAAFAKSVVSGAAAHDRMDMEAFYLAFLHGSGHESKALRYLSNLKRSIVEAVKGAHPATVDGVLCMYHQLCARYLTRYRFIPPEPEITEVRGVSSNQDGAAHYGAPRTGNATYTRIVNTLLKKRDHQVHSTSTALDLYEVVLLHSIRAISTETYLTDLCNMIEMAGNPSVCDPFCSQQSVLHTPLQYVLWRKIAYGLGPIARVIARNAPIGSDSEISKYMPAAAVKLPGRMVLTPGAGYQSINPLAARVPTISNSGSGTDVILPLTTSVTVEPAGSSTVGGPLSDTATHSQLSVAALPSPVGPPPIHPVESNTDAALSGREWWASSILSAAQLDSFTVSTVDLVAAMEFQGRASEATPSAAHGSGAAPPLGRRDGNRAQCFEDITSGETLLDSYDRWLADEKGFTAQLGELFAVRHRTMSEDLSADDSDASEKHLGDSGGTEGKGTTGTIEAEDNHTSHDDAEYHSNESEYEVANAGNASLTAELIASAGKTVTAYTYHKDILAFATGGIDACSVLQESTLLQRILPHTLPLGKATFSVQRVKTSTLKGGEKPNSLAARQARPVIQFILGDRVLEMLAHQAVVRAHMHTQDNLFTIRAVQIVMFHALRAAASAMDTADPENSGGAGYAVRFLVDSRIDIERALKIGAFLGKQGVDPAIAPPRYYELSADLTVLGAAVPGQYCPA